MNLMSEKVALVYHNLGKWPFHYYMNLGFDKLRFKLVALVLGLSACDYSNFSFGNTEQIDIFAIKKPISISLTSTFPRAMTPICISFI